MEARGPRLGRAALWQTAAALGSQPPLHHCYKLSCPAGTGTGEGPGSSKQQSALPGASACWSVWCYRVRTGGVRTVPTQPVQPGPDPQKALYPHRQLQQEPSLSQAGLETLSGHSAPMQAAACLSLCSWGSKKGERRFSLAAHMPVPALRCVTEISL